MATPASNVIPLTSDPRIDGLVQGSAWQFGANPRVITYQLTTNDTGIGGTWASEPAIANAVAQAFSEWAKVANITFSSLGLGGTFPNSTADIAVTLTGFELQEIFGAAGLGIFPDPVFAKTLRDAYEELGGSYPRPEGDVHLDNFYPAYDFMSAGGEGLTFVLHEIGHALGLKHTDDDGGNGRPTFAALGLSGLDNYSYTLMSPGSLGTGGFAEGNPATPMLLDILAIQRIYGANPTTNSGDTTYSLQADGALRAIWDVGGTDVFDASGNDSFGIVIDLRPGGMSTHGVNSQTAVAFNVTIENAIGSAQSDIIHGNDAANRLDGGSGEEASAALDRLFGYGGDDTYILDSMFDSVTEPVNAGMDRIFSSASFTLPANVESLILTENRRTSATGNELANSLIGNTAANSMVGGAGDDFLDGGAGFDLMQGGSGDDTFVVADSLAPATMLATMSYEREPIVFTAPEFGIYSIEASDDPGDGDTLVDFLEVHYGSAVSSHTGTLYLSSRMLGVPLHPGVYSDAMRFPFEATGHPGLWLAVSGSGANVSTGSFTIYEAEYDYSGTTPAVDRLLVRFDFRPENGEFTIPGILAVNATKFIPELVTELAEGGTDTVQSAVTYTLSHNVENLTLTGAAAINGTGNELDNVLIGNGAINTMTGGPGNDTYEIQSLADIVVEQPGEGVDTIRAPFSIDLSPFANFENAALSGAAAAGVTGDAGANVLTGNGSRNLIMGLDGADTLNGGAGDDTLVGGLGNDWLNGGSGVDTARYSGSKAAYAIVRSGGSATVSGAEGTDALRGVDTLAFADGTIDLIPLIRASGLDQNGDRSADLLWRSDAGQVGWWNMAGAQAKSASVMGSVPDAWTIVGTGDYNGNGRTDILWRHDGGQLAAWDTSGSSYLPSVVAHVPSNWSVVGSGNFDGAHGTDIAWRNDSGSMAVWLANAGGSGFAGYTVNNHLTDAWTLAGAGDLNADAKTDLLWRHDNGDVALWSMNGASFSGGVIARVATTWHVEALADFNADARADILWRNDSGQLGMWLMNNSTPLAQANVGGPVPLDWDIAATGDFNGDLKADIAWRHDDGTLAIWLMNGLTPSYTSTISTVGTDWFVT